jgi:hypothetical protein
VARQPEITEKQDCGRKRGKDTEKILEKKKKNIQN